MLLQRQFQEQGEQVIYQMLAGGIGDKDPCVVEVCFFGSCAIYDGFGDELNPITIQFLKTMFGFFTGSVIIEDYVLARGCLQFVNDMARVLIELQSQILPVV